MAISETSDIRSLIIEPLSTENGSCAKVSAFVDIAFRRRRMSFSPMHNAAPSLSTSYDERVLVTARIMHSALVRLQCQFSNEILLNVY